MKQTLLTLINNMEELQGSWNGKDESFMHEGDIYHEEDVSTASDIVDKAKEMIELLEELGEI